MKFLMLLLVCVFTHSLPVYRKDLRNVNKLEKHKVAARMIIEDFNSIYQQIYNEAKSGKNECRIDLRCSYTLLINGECKENINNELLYRMDHIQFDMPYKSYTNILLRKLNQTFPDSKIVQIKKPCCAYMMYW